MVGAIEPCWNLNAITPEGFSGASLADAEAFGEALARQGGSGAAAAPALQFALYNPGAQPGADLLTPVAEAVSPDVLKPAKNAAEAAAPVQPLIDLQAETLTARWKARGGEREGALNIQGLARDLNASRAKPEYEALTAAVMARLSPQDQSALKAALDGAGEQPAPGEAQAEAARTAWNAIGCGVKNFPAVLANGAISLGEALTFQAEPGAHSQGPVIVDGGGVAMFGSAPAAPKPAFGRVPEPCPYRNETAAEAARAPQAALGTGLAIAGAARFPRKPGAAAREAKAGASALNKEAALTGNAKDPAAFFPGLEMRGPQRDLDRVPGSRLSPETKGYAIGGQQGDFNSLPLGRHGDSHTTLLWTLDKNGAHFVLEQTPWDSSRKIPSHTNISDNAYFAGEAWRTGPNEVTINAGSRAFGYNWQKAKSLEGKALADYKAEMQKRYDGAVQYLRSLGLKVNVIPLVDR